MQWTKWARFCAQVRPNRRRQVSTFNNLRRTGYGFDSRRPLQTFAKFLLIRLPLLTLRLSICAHLTVVLRPFCAQVFNPKFAKNRQAFRGVPMADRLTGAKKFLLSLLPFLLYAIPAHAQRNENGVFTISYAVFCLKKKTIAA